MRISRILAVTGICGLLMIGAVSNVDAATKPKPPTKITHKVVVGLSLSIACANVEVASQTNVCKTAGVKRPKKAKKASSKSANSPNIAAIMAAPDLIWPTIPATSPNPTPPTLNNLNDNITCMVICTKP
jgi:hypothetical protein